MGDWREAGCAVKALMSRVRAGLMTEREYRIRRQVVAGNARSRPSQWSMRGPEPRASLVNGPRDCFSSWPTLARRSVQSCVLPRLICVPGRFGLHLCLDDESLVDNHVTKELRIGRRALQRELGAEQGDQSSGDVMAEASGTAWSVQEVSVAVDKYVGSSVLPWDIPGT
ncbi:unnamed protein product [Ilex paraguariensis]|uniref:Uncharacterized protein n=1 Tax=Ilex paraguariensis TaxID=185542 RepID=A0ABC8QPL7_9AQUA